MEDVLLKSSGQQESSFNDSLYFLMVYDTIMYPNDQESTVEGGGGSHEPLLLHPEFIVANVYSLTLSVLLL